MAKKESYRTLKAVRRVILSETAEPKYYVQLSNGKWVYEYPDCIYQDADGCTYEIEEEAEPPP